MDFVALRVEVNEGTLILTQPCMCEDDQVITIPLHQVDSVLKVITQEIERNKPF